MANKKYTNKKITNNKLKLIIIVEIQLLYIAYKKVKRKEKEKMDENEMMNGEEELNNIIILNDENGEEVPFEFLDVVEFEGEEYVVLLPVEEDEEDSGEVVILKIEDTESEDEESYVSVDDEHTLNQVFELFKEKFKDEFNFIDDEEE